MVDPLLNVANAIEPLPAHVSADGSEIWDWAARLSERVHLLDRIRDVSADVRAPRRCGGCRAWMTKSCPRETHSNVSGRSAGPAMNAPACGRYDEQSRVTELRDGRSAELTALKGRLAAMDRR